MKKILISIVSAFILTGNWTGAFADEGGGGEGVGSPGDPAKVSRTIEITMVENRFKPSEINVKQGETIKFVLKNAGKKKHEMMIGTPEDIDEHGKMMNRLAHCLFLICSQVRLPSARVKPMDLCRK